MEDKKASKMLWQKKIKRNCSNLNILECKFKVVIDTYKEIVVVI